MAIKNPGGLSSYVSTCALAEHFIDYRVIVRREIEAQLADFLALEKDAAQSIAVPVLEKVEADKSLA
jgi:hypothetical protein